MRRYSIGGQGGGSCDGWTLRNYGDEPVRSTSLRQIFLELLLKKKKSLLAYRKNDEAS